MSLFRAVFADEQNRFGALDITTFAQVYVMFSHLCEESNSSQTSLHKTSLDITNDFKVSSRDLHDLCNL